MKKILASLLTAYVLTNGQPNIAPPGQVEITPPVDVPPTLNQATTTAPVTGTTQASASQTTASGTTSAPGTTQPAAAVTTQSAGTTQPAAPVTTQSSVSAGTTQAQAAPVETTQAAVITPAPAPLTDAPTTSAPTFNPYCPFNAGEVSGIQPLQFNENKVCFTPNEIATDYLGRIRCDNFACCQCAQVNCGFDGYPCETAQFGDSGAVGVQSINIRGAPELNNNPLQNIFGGGGNSHGAQLECNGRESCMGAVIRGEMIREAQCSGDMGCFKSTIIINEPMDQFNMQCNGLSSCQECNIEVTVGAANSQFGAVGYQLGSFEFNGELAGSNAQVTIRNLGAGTVFIQNFECMSLQSCPGLRVNIEGNVIIENCDLMGVSPGNPAIASLVRACQAGQNIQNIGQIPGINPGFGLPQQPINPPVTQPQPPVTIPSLPNPGNPNPVPVPQTPVQQPPFNPGFPQQPGFPVGGVANPNAASLQCDSTIAMLGPGIPNPRNCANRAITLQISNGFVLDCSLTGVCNGMRLTLNAGYDPLNPMVPVTQIDTLKFVQPTNGATVYINNEFGTRGQPLRVGDVRCEGVNRCTNLKIIASAGVDIMSMNMDCQEPTACIGCTITQGAMTLPCDPVGAAFGVGGLPGQGQGQLPGQGQGQLPGQQPYNPWLV